MRSVAPGKIDGKVKAPHSKSAFQRAIACASLAKGKSLIFASDPCDDDLAGIRAARALGAKIEEAPEGFAVEGGEKITSANIDCGESGLCFRMFAAIAARCDQEITLTASGTLLERPVEMISKPLCDLGCSCETTKGYPPVKIRGPIHGGTVEIDATTSSQFLTGLLIALPTCNDDSIVLAPKLVSKPYVELTMEIMKEFGVTVKTDEELERFTIPGGQSYDAAEIEVEGDWSAASFMLVAGAIAGSVQMAGLNLNSKQADRRILDAITLAGADFTPFSFDATHCPDLFPPLVVLALRCQGMSTIRGVKRLAHKESDRAAALVDEFSKLGARIEVKGDEMIVTGGKLEGGRIDPRGDHRIAMAAAIAALTADGPIEIDGDECVSKSYPQFFRDLRLLGAGVT